MSERRFGFMRSMPTGVQAVADHHVDHVGGLMTTPRHAQSKGDRRNTALRPHLANAGRGPHFIDGDFGCPIPLVSAR